MEVTFCKGDSRATYKATSAEVISDYLVLYGEQTQYEEYMEAVLLFGGQFFWEPEVLFVDLPIQFVERIDNREE
jgi:hypothetical protein